MKNRLLTLLIIGSLFTACSSHTYDDISAEEQPEPEVVTYQDVQGIIANNCLMCHSSPPQNAAPMSLSSYTLLKDAILNRGLINRISLPDGNGALMPLGGPRLPQASIDLIVEWETDGLLEN